MTDPAVKAVGRKLRAARMEQRYTQEHISSKSGITAKSLSEFERGNRGISLETFQALCAALQVSADKILFGQIRADKNPFCYLLDKVPPSQLQHAVNLLEAYAGIYMKKDSQII